MAKRIVESPQAMKALVGQELGVSDWLVMTQERINTFAEASGDPVLARFLERLWAEIIPTVPAPQGVVLSDYARPCSSASRIRRSATAPGRSPWTVRRSCRSACSARSASA